MKWWSIKKQGVILTSQIPFLGMLVYDAVGNHLSMPPCSLRRGRRPTQCEEGGYDTYGSEENHFPSPHPHFTVHFYPSLPKPQFLQYVGQNYLNIFASFSIFSSLVISLYNSMMFSSKFSLALWTRDLSFAKVDVSSLKWNKIKCFFIWSNRGFGIVMYLIAKPLKYRDIKSEQADTRTVTRLHS